MATFTSQSLDSDYRAQDAPPVPSSSDMMALDTSMNGAAAQQNSIPEFAPHPVENGDDHTADSFNFSLPNDLAVSDADENQLISAVNPSASSSDGDTGSKATAPYMDQIDPDRNFGAQVWSDGAVPNSDLPEPRTPQDGQEDQIGGLNQAGDPFGSTSFDHPTDVVDNGTLITLQHNEIEIGEAEVPQAAFIQPSIISRPADFQALTSRQRLASDTTIMAESLGNFPESVDSHMQDSTPSSGKFTRERDEDEEDAPTAKRTKTDDGGIAGAEFKIPDIPPQAPPSPAENGVTLLTLVGGDLSPAAPRENGTSQNNTAEYDFGPIMTEIQRKRLLEGIRNILKGKHSRWFRTAVDPILHNLPNYLDIIRNPMDLSCIAQKLKDSVYRSVSEAIADFDTMVNNSITYNGQQHPVAQEGMMMNAQFQKQLKSLPKADEDMSATATKRQPSSAAKAPRDSKRRTPRPSVGSAPSPTNGSGQIFALVDGVPSIRRDSSAMDGRPKREIKKAPSRDLPYLNAKPKKKKYQMELKFCEHVHNEMLRKRYVDAFGAPFQIPVDPVALNIPNYRNLIKKPMDMRTVGENLHSGQYENAKEYEADVRLIFTNCYKFNPPSNVINAMGKDYEKIFLEEWSKKNDWMAQHAPVSGPQSPEFDSGEDEDEEEDDEVDERDTQVAALQKQIADLAEQAAAIQYGTGKKATHKSGNKKGGKATKLAGTKPSRKSGSLSGLSALPTRSEKKTKPKPKVKPITNAQKEEISKGIEKLPVEVHAICADIIKTSLRKHGRHDLADKNEENLEFDIETIPEDALHDLLKLIRKRLPQSGHSDDTDYIVVAAPSKSSAPAKSKKNKPMNQYEQDERINRVKQQMQSIQNRGSGLSRSPHLASTAEAESSGDEPESGSESEEE